MMQHKITISPESKRAHEWLATDLDRLADDLNKLADRVEAWGAKPADPREALGLIATSEDLRRRGYRLLYSDLIGHNTHISHANEANIALGVEHGDRGSLAYSMFYRLGDDEKYGHGEHNRMAVKASRIRVYASSARVVAQIARQVANAEYWRIG